MPEEKQLSLFDQPFEGDTPTPAPLPSKLIPRSAKIPIPPGIYPSIESLAEHCNQCYRCQLGNTRTHAVVGRGNPQAPIAIIGEAPGQNEDETGFPFVGKAGQLLEKILASVGFNSERDIYICNALKCLSGDTRIFTKEGAKPINWIVKNQWAGEVLSVTNSGELVWRKITGWYRSKLAERSLYKIFFKPCKNPNKKEFSCTLTGDHPILTQQGWITAAELQEDDLVATGTPAPGPRGLQVFLGSLLGEAGITASGQFYQGQNINQQAYLKLKARVLNGFRPKLREVMARLSNGRSYHSIDLDILKNHYLEDLRQQWYPNGKKDFPSEALDKLNKFGWAIWYMDSGNWHKQGITGKRLSEIHVQIDLGEIQPQTAEKAVAYFKSHGYELQTFLIGSSCKLWFPESQGLKFLEEIAAYIPSCMRDKLPEQLHKIPFQAEAFQEEAIITHWRPISKVKLPPKQNSYSVYCIDVEETANFVTPAGVVHNCRPPENRVPTSEEIAACKPYLLEQIRLIDPKIILLTGATAVKALTGDKRGITKIRGTWIKWENRLCMPIFHPSYLLRNPAREPGSPKWLMWQDIQAVRAKFDEICQGSD